MDGQVFRPVIGAAWAVEVCNRAGQNHVAGRTDRRFRHRDHRRGDRRPRRLARRGAAGCGARARGDAAPRLRPRHPLPLGRHAGAWHDGRLPRPAPALRRACRRGRGLLRRPCRGGAQHALRPPLPWVGNSSGWAWPPPGASAHCTLQTLAPGASRGAGEPGACRRRLRPGAGDGAARRAGGCLAGGQPAARAARHAAGADAAARDHQFPVGAEIDA